jgi:uncharacterized protein YndB with AHSA1/START domain
MQRVVSDLTETELVVKAAMLIRRPVADVFEAIVDPAVTTHFWFSKANGRLSAGTRVRWDWEEHGVGTDVVIREFVPDMRIVMEWGATGEMTTVEWEFDDRGDQTTFLTVTSHDFARAGVDSAGRIPREAVEQALDSTGGFTLVLAAMKAYLEHGIELNLVRDRYPDGH